MTPNPKYCQKECICWRCKNRTGDNCCYEEYGTYQIVCPEFTKFQKCPKFQPIHVQASGLNK